MHEQGWRGVLPSDLVCGRQGLGVMQRAVPCRHGRMDGSLGRMQAHNWSHTRCQPPHAQAELAQLRATLEARDKQVAAAQEARRAAEGREAAAARRAEAAAADVSGLHARLAAAEAEVERALKGAEDREARLRWVCGWAGRQQQGLIRCVRAPCATGRGCMLLIMAQS